jgi:uncharacterized protein
MSASLPASVDAERMVAARRYFEGVLLVAQLPRLAGALADDRGEATYRLDFEQGKLGGLQLHVQLQAGLTLECQFSLDEFIFPVVVDVRLGLLTDDADVDALPADCEPLLLEQGMLSPRRVIEDELLLALPLVPVKPGGTVPAGGWNTPASPSHAAGQSEPLTRPFAELRQMLEAHKNHR